VAVCNDLRRRYRQPSAHHQRRLTHRLTQWMTKKGKGKGKKTSLMGIPFSRSPKPDMATVLPSHDIDGVAE
jgi:hypothetical protein